MFWIMRATQLELSNQGSAYEICDTVGRKKANLPGNSCMVIFEAMV